jgi:cation:H+ antiporter
VRLAARLHVRPLIIGLSLVAFGSSAPQLTVSLQATLARRADVAVGSVIGSNIFNVLVILGLAALIIPLRVSRQLVRLDIPLMIAASGWCICWPAMASWGASKVRCCCLACSATC